MAVSSHVCHHLPHGILGRERERERERVCKYQLLSNTVGPVEREGQWRPQSYRSTLVRLKLCRTFNPKFIFLVDDMQ